MTNNNFMSSAGKSQSIWWLYQQASFSESPVVLWHIFGQSED